MGQNKSVVVIDYNMGNVRSVVKALELLGAEVKLSNQPEVISRAGRLVLPGVGAFADGMKNLKDLALADLLTDQVVNKKKPILGICLGLQLMARDSQEFGLHQGLGWLKASVKAFAFADQRLKIPHVGWNNVSLDESCQIFKGVKQNSEFYFVHSYHLVPDQEEIIAATCNYGYDFTAAIHQGNIYATQFHPEKSQINGLKILENFLNIAV